MRKKDLAGANWPVEIVRSARRVKTVSARLQNGTLMVQAPAHLSDAELAPIIADLQQRMQRKAQPVAQTDEMLAQRAQALNQQFFGGGLRWHSIRYVKNQEKRFGSCTPSTGVIRISHRLAEMPDWVRDYVLMHELAHLLEANHGPRFWQLVNRYPLTERARGYLMAVGLEEDDTTQMNQ
ncbi:MAG: M48 family metallopeptidase [Candidatus Promineifilaceae bacterium]